MKTRPIIISIALLIALISTLGTLGVARADGIIIPDPLPCDPAPCPPVVIPMEQLVIRYHHVTVTIKDQLAVTHVDQVFFNPNDWTIEGTYIFPIPAEAAVSGFTLWVDGKPVQGQVLDATQARQTYEQIVSSMRDPALLEYVGRGAVQARIFPIDPGQERRIELEYTQALSAKGGLVNYTYPLNTEKFSALAIESVSVSVDIQSSTPIRAVYSPSHEVAVSRDGDYHVTAGYEGSNVLPNIDFSLYYSVGQTEAFHLLTYRDATDANDPDGFFLVLIAPSIDHADVVIPKDILLVLDKSGSMDGEKFQQVQQAAKYILENLNSTDRFNIISFATGLEAYADGLRPASAVDEASSWLDGLSAGGSTDINRALLEAAAMVDPERPTYLIFLTDGLPTEGVTDSQTILDSFADSAPGNLRLFAFGVGYDVDTVLLDSLTQGHHGQSTYVQPGMQLGEILSTFYDGISTPVLTNLDLSFEGLSTYDLYPNPLPDLFAGSQLILLGRYKTGGSAEIYLSGEVDGKLHTFSFTDQAFAEQSAADIQETSIPRLWATRKVGYLLNQIRLDGANQEIIDQIVHLSIRYGIVTPYTSYLVTEETPLGLSEQERLANETFSQIQAMPTPAPAGQAAVQSSVDAGAMQGAGKAIELSGEVATTVQVVGSRTFVLSDGKWIDTAFDPETMQPTQVEFLTPAYFSLVADNAELADAFALGEQVIALSNGVAYEVVASDTTSHQHTTASTATPTTLNPTPGASQQPAQTPISSGEPTTTPANKPTASPAALWGVGLLPLLLVPLILILIKKRK